MNYKFIIILIFLIIFIYIFIKLILKYCNYRNRRLLKEYAERLKNIASDCSISYPIYYINMDKSADRREFMEEQLSKVSDNYTRIRGVNGYLIKDKTKGSVDGINFINTYTDLSLGEIGCTLSHLLAIKTAYENGDDIAIICEDDILFDICKVKEPLEDIVKDAPEDWEVLQLASDLNDKRREKYVDWNKDTKNNVWHYSTGAYFVNRKGMEKLLNNSVEGESFTLHNSKRGVADYYIYSLTKSYTINPSYFIQYNLNLDSMVHDDHTEGHIRNALNILGVIDKELNFLETLLDMKRVLDDNHQRFFIVCGTALGAYRERKFIAHDEDIDIGIFYNNYNKNIEEKILKKFYLKHRLGAIDTGYEISFTHKKTGINIDIFLHYRGEDFTWSPSFFGICDKSKYKLCRWKYDKFDMGDIYFYGVKFNIPFPTDKYLEDSYGKGWKVPEKFTYSEGLDGKYTNLVKEDFN